MNKKLKFAIIGATESGNSLDLKNEIESLGHSCALIRMTELIFQSDGNGHFAVKYDDCDMSDFDITFFRGYNQEIREAKILAEYLIYNKKTIIENVVGSGFLAGKMYEGSKLSRNNLPWLMTCQALSQKKWKEVLAEMRFPIIIKPTNGTRGRGVVKFDTAEEAIKLLRENPKEYLAQEYAPIDGDVRIVVVGEKAIGAMKRFVISGDIRSNFSLGASAASIELTDEMAAIAVAAAKAMSIEIAGVDMIFVNGSWRILEVNESPQWQGFKQTTNINPAKYIVEYAIKKQKKSQN